MNGNSLKPEDAPASIYGPDGAPQFFQDPAMDRFVAVVLNLASELWVQTERVERLQQLVADNGLSGSAPDTPADRTTDEAKDSALRDYLDRVLAPLRDPAG
jgi:hypothetical protein